MSWVKMDDSAYLNAKVLEVPPETRWLWFASISYSNHQNTGGRISRGVAQMLAGGNRNWERHAKRLVAAGLWDAVEPAAGERPMGSFTVHDWEEYQRPAREASEHRREVSRIRSEAGKKGGQASAASRWGKQNVSKREASGNQTVSPLPVKASHSVRSIADDAPAPPPPVAVVPEPSGVHAVALPSQLSLADAPPAHGPTRARKRVVDASSGPSRADAHAAIRKALTAAAERHGRSLVFEYEKLGKLSNRLMRMYGPDGEPLGVDGVVRLIGNASTYKSWVDGGCDLGWIVNRPGQYSVPFGPTLASTQPTLVPFDRARLL